MRNQSMKDRSGPVQGTFKCHFRLVTQLLSRAAIVVSLPEYSWACSPPKKMRLTRTTVKFSELLK
jgi:hypothetical protein